MIGPRAIAAAVRSWRFEPAWRYRRVHDDDGGTRLVPQKIPTAQRLLIRFRLEAGKPVVE